MINSLKTCLFFSTFLLLSISAEAQKITTKLYDRDWKECEISNARFYSTVEKTDSGWLRNDYYVSTNGLQMKALYKDSLCKIKNGSNLHFFANDQLKSSAIYINDKLEGTYTRFHNNGMTADSGSYINGKLTGNSIGWHSNGFMSDSVFVKNDSIKIEVEWFDNGNPSEYGYYINDKKHGKWNYFHKNGNPACIELNDHGKVISADFFNEDGSIQNDTSVVNRQATFKKGDKDWVNYLSGKIYWPQEYKLTNTDIATVVVLFVIDEEGKVATQYIDVPFHYLMDNIALDAIKKSPLWKPALDHNRRIKAYRKQPLTFTQE